MQHSSDISLTIGAVGVLQTEAGFVALSHFGPIESEQVIVGEHLNAVVVPGNETGGWGYTEEVSLLLFLLCHLHLPVKKRKQNNTHRMTCV